MGKLVLQLPDGGTRDIQLESERITIGRRADNDVCLPFPAVSGEHAAVVTILDDSFLEDLNSTNGTLVNGKPIAKHFLRDLDEIDIGRQKLVYHSTEYSASVATSAAEKEADAIGVAEIDAALQAPAAKAPSGEGTLPLAALLGGAQVDTSTRFATPSTRDDATSLLNRAPADAPTLEVLDGPSAGHQVVVANNPFVLGRIGVQVASVNRSDEGFRLMHVEGGTRAKVNGTALADNGTLLAIGDEIEVAGTRLVYRPAI
ncbi:MAG TPA: FHA domain-containing protein [Casimicrobiaceae bacterium]|nr:FHA domain-containing protein [Casimicrobiaceae bacterium]